MWKIVSFLREHMIEAQGRMETKANRNREPAPAYRVGDMVYLDARNISRSRPINKFAEKYLGPFAIEKVIGSHAYSLNLPPDLDLARGRTFHTNLLRPAPGVTILGQVNPPPPPAAIDENGELLWQIEAIVDSQ